MQTPSTPSSTPLPSCTTSTMLGCSPPTAPPRSSRSTGAVHAAVIRNTCSCSALLRHDVCPPQLVLCFHEPAWMLCLLCTLLPAPTHNFMALGSVQALWAAGRLPAAPAGAPRPAVGPAAAAAPSAAAPQPGGSGVQGRARGEPASLCPIAFESLAFSISHLDRMLPAATLISFAQPHHRAGPSADSLYHPRRLTMWRCSALRG